MNGNNTGPKVAIGCGGAMLLLAFCVTAFFGFHAFVDRGGAISGDEAMPGFLGGFLCMFVDFVIVAVGIALVMRGGSPGPQGSAMPQGSFPQGGTQVMQGGSLPGAPTNAQPTPWHLLTGCGTLFFVVTLCLSFGGIGYFYSEVERWERNLADDQAHAYDPYGGGGGVDDLLVMIDQGAVEENEQYTGASSCCCFFSFLMACALGGGTVQLIRKRRQAGIS
jgi:hypothetical protein